MILQEDIAEILPRNVDASPSWSSSFAASHDLVVDAADTGEFYQRALNRSNTLDSFFDGSLSENVDLDHLFDVLSFICQGDVRVAV